MKKSLDPEQSASLAEWLANSRVNPAPIAGTFPLAELMIAMNAGLMGVTHADVERGMAEIIGRIRSQPRTGPPSLGGLVLDALPGRPFRAENGAWLPADAVAPWS